MPVRRAALSGVIGVRIAQLWPQAAPTMSRAATLGSRGHAERPQAKVEPATRARQTKSPVCLRRALLLRCVRVSGAKAPGERQHLYARQGPGLGGESATR